MCSNAASRASAICTLKGLIYMLLSSLEGTISSGPNLKYLLASFEADSNATLRDAAVRFVGHFVAGYQTKTKTDVREAGEVFVRVTGLRYRNNIPGDEVRVVGYVVGKTTGNILCEVMVKYNLKTRQGAIKKVQPLNLQ